MTFDELLPGAGAYRLDAPSIDVFIDRIVLSAVLTGPPDAPVWARAWISNEAGTLAETATGQHTAGERIAIEVPLTVPAVNDGRIVAYMRIESAPLATEQVISHPLRAVDGKWAVGKCLADEESSE